MAKKTQNANVEELVNNATVESTVENSTLSVDQILKSNLEPNPTNVTSLFKEEKNVEVQEAVKSLTGKIENPLLLALAKTFHFKDIAEKESSLKHLKEQASKQGLTPEMYLRQQVEAEFGEDVSRDIVRKQLNVLISWLTPRKSAKRSTQNLVIKIDGQYFSINKTDFQNIQREFPQNTPEKKAKLIEMAIPSEDTNILEF